MTVRKPVRVTRSRVSHRDNPEVERILNDPRLIELVERCEDLMNTDTEAEELYDSLLDMEDERELFECYHGVCWTYKEIGNAHREYKATISIMTTLLSRIMPDTLRNERERGIWLGARIDQHRIRLEKLASVKATIGTCQKMIGVRMRLLGFGMDSEKEEGA